jgi:capsular polysaccharide biosynthesis protein
MSEATRPLGLEHYVYTVRRQWRVVAAGVVLGLLVSGAYLLFTPREYTATTDVRLNVISSDPFSAAHADSTLLDPATETQIAGSDAVAKAAAEALGDGISAKQLRDGSSISAATGGTVVHVSYTAPTVSAAEQGSDAIAAAYLDYRSTAAKKQITSILGNIQTSLTTLQSKLADANAAVSAAAPGAATSQASSSRDLIAAEINSVLSQRGTLQQIDTSGGTLLTAAASNDVTHKPSTGLVLAIGFLAGLVLGLIVAFPVNHFDRKIRTRREAEHQFGGLLLATVSSTHAELPESGTTLDEFRSLRERLLSRLDDDLRKVVVIDDTQGPQSSDVAANLALTTARSGVPTQLVVATSSDSYRSELRSRLGLTRVAADKSGGLFRSSAASGLTVYISPNSDPDAESDALVTQRVANQLESASPDQLVILSLPPEATQSSRLAADRLTDAAVFVVAINHSRTDRLEEFFDELDSSETEFIGAISVPRGRSLAIAEPATKG